MTVTVHIKNKMQGLGFFEKHLVNKKLVDKIKWKKVRPYIRKLKTKDPKFIERDPVVFDNLSKN